MKQWKFCMLAAALFALLLCAHAENPSQTIAINSPVWLDTGEYRFEFMPPVGGYYTFFTYGAEDVEITLTQNEVSTPVSEEEMLLNSDSPCRIHITANESFRFEIMRSARGKSILEPIELTEEKYAKLITREGEIHWYCLTPKTDGVFTIASEPTDDQFLLASGQLYDENYIRIADAEGIKSMNGFVIQEPLKSGKTYYLRIHSKQQSVGGYLLYITSGGISSPTKITLLETELTVYLDEERELNARIFPLGAHLGLRYLSEDPQIAMVTQSGMILPRSAGETVIHVYGYGSAQAECKVTVPEIAAESVILNNDVFELNVGETAKADYRILPEEATNRQVIFSISNDTVASISEDGIITANSAGETLMAIFSEDGIHYDTARIIVNEQPPQYRALVAGVRNDTNESERIGAVNTTTGIADMLCSMSIDGNAYEVLSIIDPAKEDLLKGIDAAFANAAPSDISLLYINAHGGVTGSDAWVRLADGSLLTAKELESCLRRVPGVIVVIIDCCQSGAFIGDTNGFCDAVISAFSSSPFASSKYKVLTSSAANEDSYRISSGSEQTEANMATVFGRSLAEGAGWDLIKDQSAVMRADMERDRRISLHEIFIYTKKRTNWRLSNSDVRQTVMVYPEGDPILLFSK